MIRHILFRVDGTGEWQEGVVHVFVGENCVVETAATGELQLVPVKPDHLKFKMLMDQWIEAQVQAQAQAQQRTIRAVPPPDFRR